MNAGGTLHGLTAEQAVVSPFGLVLLFGHVPAIEKALKERNAVVVHKSARGRGSASL